jgi:hypothetical protein
MNGIRYSGEVVLEGGFVLVTGHEDNLKLLAVLVHVLVELSQDGSEASAGRAPI